MADQNQKDDPLSLHYGSAQPGEGILLTPAQEAAAGGAAQPKMVTMDVLSDRSYNGRTYHVGETVEVPEDLVETLTLSGFAARVDRVARAQQARDADKARADALKQRSGKRSTAVAPMGTQNIGAAPHTGEAQPVTTSGETPGHPQE